MSSNVLAAFLFGGFFIYITAKGSLPNYISIFFGTSTGSNAGQANNTTTLTANSGGFGGTSTGTPITAGQFQQTTDVTVPSVGGFGGSSTGA